MENNAIPKDISTATFKKYPDVVNPVQMSEMLGISTKTAYKLLRTNSIKHFKIGRTYKIPKINIISFIGID
jgi:excisionase family DNA binding protein